MISRKFVKCFKQQHLKEHFQTATSEIIGESRPFLKKMRAPIHYQERRDSAEEGRDSADRDFPKMLQNFPEHLIHLSTGAPLRNNS